MSRAKDPATHESIKTWAMAKGIDAVIWTDLASNFVDACGHRFSIAAAVAHLQGLDPVAKAGAAEYVWRAPAFITTPLRTILQAEPWFKA